MKKNKLIVALLAVMCVFAFSACGATFDPIAYVQGTLDVNVYGTVSDEYLSTLENPDEAVAMEEQYNELLASNTETLLLNLGITDYDDALLQETIDMFSNVYANCKFEVNPEYTEDENGNYYVEVLAYPLLTYTEVCFDEDGSIQAALEKSYTSDMTQNDLICLYLEILIDEVNTAMENPEYGDPVSFEVEVTFTEDGKYLVDTTTINEICMALLSAN